MPLHLEKVRDKLAENIHELWGMNKIELGWSYGKVRSTRRVKKKIKKKNPHSASMHFFLPCLWRDKRHRGAFGRVVEQLEMPLVVKHFFLKTVIKSLFVILLSLL